MPASGDRMSQSESFIARCTTGSRRLAGVAALRVLEERRTPAARVVALPRPLDLDHLGAEVGEVLRGPGAGEHARQVEDANTVEDCGHGSEFWEV